MCHPSILVSMVYESNVCHPLILVSVVLDYKDSLHLVMVIRYLRRMGDKTIPDEAPPILESRSRRYRSTTIKVLWTVCLVHR